MEVKSRILKFINKELMTELNSIALDVLIPDNNTKMNLFISAFEKYNIPYQELGPGTNRGAFLIDGYVFKIGFDKAGIADNWAEFSLGQELQPFVTKTYECNGLIAVSEYVTVISKDEFINSREEVRQILSHLADSYLLGDVGAVTKNFMNWGYRADGSLVILDYAYIYRVIGDELICDGLLKDESTCGGSLEYDQNFHKLICPKCRRQYTFHEIRRKISKEYEEREKNVIKTIAYKLTKPSQTINTNSTAIMINTEGEKEMSKYDYYENKIEKEEPVEYTDDLYADAIEFMRNLNESDIIENCDDMPEPDSNPKEMIADMSDVEEVIENFDTEDNIEVHVNEEDEDDSDFTHEEIMSIIDHESAIEEAVSEDEIEAESTNYINETDEVAEEAYQEEIDEDNLVDDIETGDIISIENTRKPYEKPTLKIIDNIEDVEMDIEDTSDIKISIDTPTTDLDITVSNESSSETVKITTKNDTIVLTTPDNVDAMRALLASDIEEDDKYSEYDDENVGFQKIRKNKKEYR